MNRQVTLSLLPLLLALATGCGPIRSTVGIIQAEQVLREARELGAAEVAPYPMTVAEELVRKAVEEQGYADYSTSWQLATEARDLVRATLEALPRTDVQPEQEPESESDEYEGIEDPTATEPGRRHADEGEEADPLLKAAEEARQEQEQEEAEREFEEPEPEAEPEPDEPEETTPAPNPWLDEPEEAP